MKKKTKLNQAMLNNNKKQIPLEEALRELHSMLGKYPNEEIVQKRIELLGS